MRIAMWSGPRNLSTAMMYSFGNRADFAISDEPFYGAYLAMTGLGHPLRAEIIASMEADPGKVARELAGPVPNGKPHWYQKHMTHHMIGAMPMDWSQDMRHVFLIRHPARVIASYAAKRENPTVHDLGYAQQVSLFEEVAGYGDEVPIVIDSADIRRDPEGMLRRLCDALDLPWDPAMLSWPAGPRTEDGIWARHWYGAVHVSTGFAGAEGPLPEVAANLRPLLAESLEHYRLLEGFKL